MRTDFVDSIGVFHVCIIQVILKTKFTSDQQYHCMSAKTLDESEERLFVNEIVQ